MTVDPSDTSAAKDFPPVYSRPQNPGLARNAEEIRRIEEAKIDELLKALRTDARRVALQTRRWALEQLMPSFLQRSFDVTAMIADAQTLTEWVLDGTRPAADLRPDDDNPDPAFRT